MDIKILTFRTIIEKDGKAYHGYVPTLPGCHTQGDTIEETRKNLKEAIEGILLVMKKHNQPLPTDVGIETIETINVERLFTTTSYA